MDPSIQSHQINSHDGVYPTRQRFKSQQIFKRKSCVWISAENAMFSVSYWHIACHDWISNKTPNRLVGLWIARGYIWNAAMTRYMSKTGTKNCLSGWNSNATQSLTFILEKVPDKVPGISLICLSEIVWLLIRFKMIS